ncbi:MAG: AAA family ATPase [Micromonosporaceae bacterium]|nr:AAA family ATPase [Micromonosporaceae bacterium]
MVGRDHELHRLARFLGAPHPRVVIIAGEPGIGKSRLVQELVAIAPPEARVLIGQADPGTLSRPFELLLDAVDIAADLEDPELLATVTDSGRPMVERLRAGLGLVWSLTADHPSLVVFEDLHWVDSESAALFERIADLPGAGRLLVGTYRPDEVTRRHPVADLLTRLERRHTVTHVRLSRFTLSDTSAFLAAVTGQPPPYRAAVTLHNRTGGNPFFLEELLRASDGADLGQLCEQPLPWNLAEALRHQLVEIEPDQQQVIEAAAVLGRKIPFDLLAAVTRSTEDALIGTLRGLVRRGLMVEIGDDEFGFRHALTREALAEQLLGRERRRLHELALETLLSSGSTDWAIIAHHARGAGRYDDLVSAARKGAEHSLAIGSAYQALQLAEDGLGECPHDVDLLAAAAQAAWLVGLLDDADRHARHWLAAATTPDGRAAALRLLIRVAWEGSRIEDMTALTVEIEAVSAILPHGRVLAETMAAIAQSYMLRDLPREAVSWADRTIALADDLNLPRVRLSAEVEKGSSLTFIAATVEEGGRLLLKAATEAEELGEWLVAARAINNTLDANLVTSPSDMATLLERMRSDAEKAGFDALAVAAYHDGRARLAIQEGDIAAAIAAVEEGRRHDQGLLRTAQGVDYHGVLLGGLALEASDVERAETILTGLLAARGRLRYAVPGLEFHVACRMADLPRAEAALDEVFAVIESAGSPAGDYVHDLVSAGLHAGLPILRIRRLAGLMRRQPVGGWWQLVEGQIAEAAGEHTPALASYLRAAEDDALPPAPRGTAHAGAARCCGALGNLEPARAHTAAAASLLARWSGWRVAQVTALRIQLGCTADGPATQPQLTPREREVAVLLTEHLTNAEIARRLYISPRTAAVHVSNILSKLGLTSRTEIVTWIRQTKPPE